MKEIISNLPNMLTLGNLACGLLGIMQVYDNRPELAFWFIVAAAILDFFDGFLARLLNASGEMGKQLDSLADLVSFGVLPGLIIWNLMEKNGYCPAGQFCINRYVWLIFPLAGAWRLAKFNIDTRQSSGFLGVPIPISGLALASIAISVDSASTLSHFYTNFYVLKGMPMLMAFLMVSELPMLALKFKKGDPLFIYKVLLIAISLGLVAFFRFDSLPLVYAVYVLFSIFTNFAAKINAHG